MKNKLSMDKVMQIVDEELKSAKKRILTRIRRCLKDGNQSSSNDRNMKLKFTNKIPDIILTSQEIKVEGDTHLEVSLVDDPSERTVDVGPEASARVQIVLLKGDNNEEEEEEFDQNIVPEIPEKKSLLDGNVAIKLERGVGVVRNVKLRNHAIKIKPAVFKLGARVVDNFRVKEARTGAFTVKDYRNKYHKKHSNPSLSDEVSRLRNIAYCGNIYKRLQSNGIKTVEDFLIRLLINRDELKNIVGMGSTKWEATIENARACSSETRMYCYVNLEQKKAVVFNVLGQAVGLYDSSQYSPMMNEEHKAYAEELLASAYKNWGDVKAFDDLDSVHQHLITCLSTDCPKDSPQDCPGDGHEMIGETSSRRSYASFHSISSALNSVGGEDFSSFGTDDMEVETMYDAVMYSPVNYEALFFPDFDDFLQQRGCNEQLENESINGEAEVVQTSESPKRWKNLLSRIFSLKKRGSVDVAPHHKKQKIG